MLGWEEFLKEQLELVQLVVLTDSLFAADQLVHPFVVLSPFSLILLQLVPDALEGRDVDLDLVAELVNEAEQVEHFSHYAVPVCFVLVVLDGGDDHLIDVLLC